RDWSSDVCSSDYIAYDARQVEMQHALVFGARQAVGPQSGVLGVGLYQSDLLVLSTSEFQVVDGLLVNVEHRGRGAVLGRHVRNGRAVSQGQVRSAFAIELEIGGDHLFAAQELGQGQYQVG